MFLVRSRRFYGRFSDLLETSSFRHTITIAFVFLLVSLSSVVLSRHLIDVILHNHVTEMIMRDVTAQVQQTRLGSSVAVSRSLLRREQANPLSERRSIVADAASTVTFGDAALFSRLNGALPPCRNGGCDPLPFHLTTPDADIFGVRVSLADGGAYFSGYDIRSMSERVRIIPLAAGSGLFVVLLAALFISLYFSMTNLRRVEGISQALERFASGHPDARASLGDNKDEFARLSLEINQALDRFNRLVEEIKSSSGHIAHELRTPLTRLQNRLISLSERAGGNIGGELVAAVEDIDRIQVLFRSIMRISEVETWSSEQEFRNIDARALLTDVAYYYQPLAEQQGCALEVTADPGCALFGDRDLLFQALANLVDNALKYAPSGSRVELAAHMDGEWARLSVRDCGKGIPEDLRASAMQRFRRLSNAADKPGVGLGLPLVKAIAERHCGALSLEDARPGLLATLKLKPASGEPDEALQP